MAARQPLRSQWPQRTLGPEGGAAWPGYAGDPDNFGCGFLDGDRLFTTAIGNPFPGEPACLADD